MDHDTLHRDDPVRLITKPDGYTSQHLPLTIGNTYKILDVSGSNVITTTDDPNIEGYYWRGRVEKVQKMQTPR
jgi:hypothetical protein